MHICMCNNVLVLCHCVILLAEYNLTIRSIAFYNDIKQQIAFDKFSCLFA